MRYRFRRSLLDRNIRDRFERMSIIALGNDLGSRFVVRFLDNLSLWGLDGLGDRIRVERAVTRQGVERVVVSRFVRNFLDRFLDGLRNALFDRLTFFDGRCRFVGICRFFDRRFIVRTSFNLVRLVTCV